MTLIVRELIIRGTVKSDATEDQVVLNSDLEAMKARITEDCIDAVLSKLESKPKG